MTTFYFVRILVSCFCLDNLSGSLYHFTMKDDIEGVFTRLHALFPNHIQLINPCWELCEWSRVYRIGLLDEACLYLKGAPRSRSEAVVTQRLHAICPTSISKVIATDLTPASSWR
jgi:hypothetical protein